MRSSPECGRCRFTSYFDGFGVRVQRRRRDIFVEHRIHTPFFSSVRSEIDACRLEWNVVRMYRPYRALDFFGRRFYKHVAPDGAFPPLPKQQIRSVCSFTCFC